VILQGNTVLTHRPGLELARITPRAQADLPFGRLPWLGRAREEHGAFTETLRELGAEVLYATELLQDCLEYLPARGEARAGERFTTHPRRPGDRTTGNPDPRAGYRRARRPHAR
jgi:arginine deiminase